MMEANIANKEVIEHETEVDSSDIIDDSPIHTREEEEATPIKKGYAVE